jgi:hypothetical protein
MEESVVTVLVGYTQAEKVIPSSVSKDQMAIGAEPGAAAHRADDPLVNRSADAEVVAVGAGVPLDTGSFVGHMPDTHMVVPPDVGW